MNLKIDMKFKEYPKTYEDFYSSSTNNRGCRYNKISFDGDGSVEGYIELLRDETRKSELNIFDSLVKIIWVIRKFRYQNQRKIFFKANGKAMDIAFSIFMRRYIGTPADLWSSNRMNSAIYSYFDDFFPGFDQGNPFETKHEYPFRYMNFGCLMFVYKMDERLDLLAIGEKRQMNYIEFVDYVVNYVLSYNEEHGDKYTLAKNIASTPFAHIKKVLI